MEYIEMLEEQLRLHETNQTYALVTILGTGGDTTRTQGKMLVHEDGSILGSIGGGAMERVVIRDAVEAIKIGHSGEKDYDMNTRASEAGNACGGAMRVLIEVFGSRPSLVVCGAGHVGMALIAIARTVGFRIILLDNRGTEFIADKMHLVDQFVAVNDYEEGVKNLEVAPGAYYVIAGPNHDCDSHSLAGALTKDGAYVGMIGGPRKINALFARLKERGYTQEQLDSVYTPIGLDVGNETPEEIAVSILAELLMVKNGKNRPAGV